MSYMSPAARTGYYWHMDYYWQGKVITGAWTYSWRMDPQIRHGGFLGISPFNISLSWRNHIEEDSVLGCKYTGPHTKWSEI